MPTATNTPTVTIPLKNPTSPKSFSIPNQFTLTQEMMLKERENLKKFFNEDYNALVDTSMPELKTTLLFQYKGYEGGPASGLRVMAIACDRTGCGFYRVKYPMMVLASQGACVEVHYHDTKHPLSMEPFFRCNVIYFNREIDRKFSGPYLSMARSLGITVVFDMDDLLHRIDKENPVSFLYEKKVLKDEEGNLLPIGKAALETLEQYMGLADGCIFSTRELRAHYKEFAKRSFVMQNGLDLTFGDRDWDGKKPRYNWRQFADMQHVEYDDDTLLFGVSCGSTHKVDLRHIAKVVPAVLEAVPNTLFGIQTDTRTAYEFCVLNGLPLDRVVYLPATNFTTHPRCLTAFDVALCPLDNTLFTRAKSCLRILEFGAWGIPYVSSNVAPFRRFHNETHGKGGFLARSQQDWVKNVTTLLINPDLRSEKGNWLKEYIRKNFDIRNTYSNLAITIKGIRLAKNGSAEIPGLTETRDLVGGLPILPKFLQPKSLCPCGSNRHYRSCCFPAWG